MKNGGKMDAWNVQNDENASLGQTSLIESWKYELKRLKLCFKLST